MGSKVIHRHRVGACEFTRVSELVYVGGLPMAVLSWLHHGAGRVPAVCAPLDEKLLTPGARLRARAKQGRQVWLYRGVTVDHRFEHLAAQQEPDPGGTKPPREHP